MDRAAVIRAMRAYLDLDQADVAAAAGVSLRTLKAAERGGVSDKSWGLLLACYAARGLEWREDERAMAVVAGGRP